MYILSVIEDMSITIQYIMPKMWCLVWEAVSDINNITASLVMGVAITNIVKKEV